MNDETLPDDFDPAAPLKNRKHEAFTLALYDGLSQTHAYIAAGYSVQDEDSAGAHGSRLVGNGKVHARLRYLQDQRSERHIMSVSRRKEVLSLRAEDGRIGIFMQVTPDGEMIPDINAENYDSFGLAEMTMSYKKDPGEGDGAEDCRILKLKAADPVKPIAELNKMEGIYPAAKVDTDAWKSIIMDVGFGTGTLPENQDIEDG